MSDVTNADVHRPTVQRREGTVPRVIPVPEAEEVVTDDERRAIQQAKAASRAQNAVGRAGTVAPAFGIGEYVPQTLETASGVAAAAGTILDQLEGVGSLLGSNTFPIPGWDGHWLRVREVTWVIENKCGPTTRGIAYGKTPVKAVEPERAPTKVTGFFIPGSLPRK